MIAAARLNTNEIVDQPMKDLPSSIHQTEIVPGYPVFEIQHPAAHARITLHGAHLTQWTPTSQQPVIYLSPEAIFQEGKAIRGGIPICWPWFGHHESDPKLPQHGFVRTRPWELSDASENASDIRLKFTMQDSEETLRLWPHAFRLTLEMRIGAELHLALETENTSDAPFTITDALHTYLAVGDIRQVTIEGLDDTDYLDTVGTKQERHQSGDITIDREVDRQYHSSNEIRVHDQALNRLIAVQNSGSQTTVVWNPWIAKAAALADLPDKDYQRFVCVETANAWNDRITLAPGANHLLATTIRILA
jgi:glucose-6-phosphate 1-epimerase